MRWPWKNDIINGLDARHSEMLMPHLHRVSLSRGEVIESSGDCISSVYFPETAVLSLTAAPEAGKCSDVAFVGFEGMSGVSLVLGSRLAAFSKVTRISGTAIAIPADAFESVLSGAPDLRLHFLKYVEALRYQVRATVAATSQATLDRKLARVLLMMHDRAKGGHLRITHATLASMLGATRPAVSAACADLHADQLVRCSRARVEVIDRVGLQALCGSLYGDAEKHYARLLTGTTHLQALHVAGC